MKPEHCEECQQPLNAAQAYVLRYLCGKCYQAKRNERSPEPMKSIAKEEYSYVTEIQGELKLVTHVNSIPVDQIPPGLNELAHCLVHVFTINDDLELLENIISDFKEQCA